MRYIVIIGLAVIAGLIIRKNRKYTGRILLALALIMTAMSALYNVRNLNSLLKFVRPFNQAFYQTAFLDEGEYPDSFLMSLLEGKTVYVKDDVYMINEAEEHGKNFNYALYHARNEYYFLDYLKTDLIKDASMNDVIVTDDLISRDFESLGQINYMLRYSFLYVDLPYESANYFAYYWYYYEYLDRIDAYMCTEADSKGETVFTSNDLVMFWNTVDGVEEEDLYIMTRDYYENNLSGGEVAVHE